MDCDAAKLPIIGPDDIDWRAATITLWRTKGCREDVRPSCACSGASTWCATSECKPLPSSIKT